MNRNNEGNGRPAGISEVDARLAASKQAERKRVQRERIAVRIYPHFLSKNYASLEDVAKSTIAATDCLIAALEKTQERR